MFKYNLVLTKKEIDKVRICQASMQREILQTRITMRLRVGVENIHDGIKPEPKNKPTAPAITEEQTSVQGRAAQVINGDTEVANSVPVAPASKDESKPKPASAPAPKPAEPNPAPVTKPAATQTPKPAASKPRKRRQSSFRSNVDVAREAQRPVEGRSRL